MAKLYFRYGAMNSGKSTALMQVAHNYEEQGMRVLILKPKVDTKGGGRPDGSRGRRCPWCPAGAAGHGPDGGRPGRQQRGPASGLCAL